MDATSTSDSCKAVEYVDNIGLETKSRNAVLKWVT